MKKPLFILIFAASAFSSVNKRGDYQLWTCVHSRIQLIDQLALKLESELRIGNDVSEPFLLYGQATLEYLLLKHLKRI